MTLDPMPSAAELLRKKAEREARRMGVRLALPEPAQMRTFPTLTFPVRLRIPWSMLISDNRKYGVINGQMLLTSEYRRAKERIEQLAKREFGDVEPAAFLLKLEAAVYLPDRRPHDVANFGKCVHDALEGVVYVKDRWLDDVRWYRAGVDVDAPRAEIVISPC